MDTNRYLEERTELLKQLQRVNEDFLSSIDNWESYDGHLNARDELMKSLIELDEEFGLENRKLVDEERAKEMDSLLKLVIALDRDISEALNKERAETLEAMKVTTRGKKLASYSFGHGGQSESQGNLLDIKE